MSKKIISVMTILAFLLSMMPNILYAAIDTDKFQMESEIILDLSEDTNFDRVVPIWDNINFIDEPESRFQMESEILLDLSEDAHFDRALAAPVINADIEECSQSLISGDISVSSNENDAGVVPGDAMYFADRFGDWVKLRLFSFTVDAKINTLLDQAQEKIGELERLQRQNNLRPQYVDKIVTSYNNKITEINERISELEQENRDITDIVTRVSKMNGKNRVIIANILTKISEQNRASMQSIYTSTNGSYCTIVNSWINRQNECNDSVVFDAEINDIYNEMVGKVSEINDKSEAIDQYYSQVEEYKSNLLVANAGVEYQIQSLDSLIQNKDNTVADKDAELVSFKDELNGGSFSNVKNFQPSQDEVNIRDLLSLNTNSSSSTWLTKARAALAMIDVNIANAEVMADLNFVEKVAGQDLDNNIEVVAKNIKQARIDAMQEEIDTIDDSISTFNDGYSVLSNNKNQCSDLKKEFMQVKNALANDNISRAKEIASNLYNTVLSLDNDYLPNCGVGEMVTFLHGLFENSNVLSGNDRCSSTDYVDQLSTWIDGQNDYWDNMLGFHDELAESYREQAISYEMLRSSKVEKKSALANELDTINSENIKTGDFYNFDRDFRTAEVINAVNFINDLENDLSLANTSFNSALSTKNAKTTELSSAEALVSSTLSTKNTINSELSESITTLRNIESQMENISFEIEQLTLTSFSWLDTGDFHIAFYPEYLETLSYEEAQAYLEEKQQLLNRLTGGYENELSNKTSIEAELDTATAAYNSAVTKKNSIVSELDSATTAYNSAVIAKNSIEADADQAIAAYNSAISNKNSIVAELDSATTAYNSAVIAKNSIEADADQAIAAYNSAIGDKNSIVSELDTATTAYNSAVISADIIEEDLVGAMMAYDSAVSKKNSIVSELDSATTAYNSAVIAKNSIEADVDQAISAYNSAISDKNSASSDLVSATATYESALLIKSNLELELANSADLEENTISKEMKLDIIRQELNGFMTTKMTNTISNYQNTVGGLELAKEQWVSIKDNYQEFTTDFTALRNSLNSDNILDVSNIIRNDLKPRVNSLKSEEYSVAAHEIEYNLDSLNWLINMSDLGEDRIDSIVESVKESVLQLKDITCESASDIYNQGTISVCTELNTGNFIDSCITISNIENQIIDQCKVNPENNCGNGIIDSTEDCDDGNKLSGDGCTALCQSEITAYCGDGRIQKPNSYGIKEECENIPANSLNGDGCNSQCLNETDAYCGDGILQQPNDKNFSEQCDDGNKFIGDGCNNLCQIERGLQRSIKIRKTIP